MPSYANQHYVPKFLLERWHGGADEKLTAFRWAHGALTHRRYRAKSVAKAHHLYSMQRSRTEPDVQVERDFLGPHVDDPAAVVHKKILLSGVRSLTDDDKVNWSPFLVSLMLRVPRMMDHMRKRGREILTAGLDQHPSEFADVRGEAPKQTLREWVQKNEPDLLEDLAVRTLPKLVCSQSLNGALLGARWATRPVPTARFDLMISDRPLIYVGTFGSRFLVCLPLSPRLAFLAFNDDAIWDNVVRRSDDIFVREMNLSTVCQAETFAYATDARQASFVGKYLPKPDQPSLPG